MEPQEPSLWSLCEKVHKVLILFSFFSQNECYADIVFENLLFYF